MSINFTALHASVYFVLSIASSNFIYTSAAGSAGDPNAAQLIVENRAVTLEYARESTERPPNNHNSSHHSSHSGDSTQGQGQSHPYRGREREDRDGGGRGGGGSQAAGLDWICSSVSNF